MIKGGFNQRAVSGSVCPRRLHVHHDLHSWWEPAAGKAGVGTVPLLAGALQAWEHLLCAPRPRRWPVITSLPRAGGWDSASQFPSQKEERSDVSSWDPPILPQLPGSPQAPEELFSVLFFYFIFLVTALLRSIPFSSPFKAHNSMVQLNGIHRHFPEICKWKEKPQE